MLSVRKLAALAYNAFHAVGWAYALALMMNSILLSGNGNEFDFEASGGGVVVALQTIALVEPILCLFGVIPSSIITVIFQLIARNVVILLAVARHPELQDHTSVKLFLVGWMAIEVIRFPWLCFKIVGQPPKALTYIRYAAPLLLYPIGGAGEGWTMWRAKNSADAFTFAGASFTLGSFIVYVYLPLYLPGFFYLYANAFKQFKRQSKRLAAPFANKKRN